MIKLVSFRPDVIGNGTAFEAMALIYKYLQDHYGYSFTMVKSEEDDYYDRELKIISIPKKSWKVNPYAVAFPGPWVQDKYLEPIFNQADGILTVDPTVYVYALVAIRKAYQMGKPVWFDTSVTTIGINQSIGWKLRSKLLKASLRQATGIIATVPKCIERMQDAGLINEAIASKFTIMGHPVDTARFAPQPKQSAQDGILRVLVVSRLIPHKGVFYILEAMTPLLKQQRNLQLQFLGSGSMRSLLQQEAEERGLGEQVVFLNPVPHQELASVIATADIFVNHAVGISFWEEYFGAINLEAMACGLPCVASTNGGIPYSIREKDVAILVTERNIIQLREAIAQLIASESLRIEMGQKARDYVERHYGLPLIADKYHRMIQRGFSKFK